MIGTRGSALALWQARHVAELLRAAHDGLVVDERIVKTEGDLKPDSAVANLGERGVFVRRLEQSLLAGEVDLAVHSLKDMPTQQPSGLRIVAVTERHDPRDTLLSLDGWRLEELPPGTVVGTGSVRRRSQLLHVRPDIEVAPVRGNVDTRVRKLREGGLGGLVLAVAGVERLGITSVKHEPLGIETCLPAAGQGALALETREDDGPTRELVERLNHPQSLAAVKAERAFLRRLGGGCLAPATAYARIEDSRLVAEGFVGDPDGRAVLLERERGDPADAAVIGTRLAERLLVAGATKILQSPRPDPARGRD